MTTQIMRLRVGEVAGTNLGRLLRWTYMPTLFFSGANTLCTIIFQFAILSKLGVGARSDLYFASIIVPVVAYTVAFGALNSVLVPMFVEAKARSNGEEAVLLWNALLVTTVGGLLLSSLLCSLTRFAFPLLFRKLVWIDLHQVSYVVLAYSCYQLLYLAVMAKNCFLFAQGRALSAQASVFCGWVVSLGSLSQIHPAHDLWRIPICLVAGNGVAFLFPGLGREAFFYRRGLLKQHVMSFFARTWPVTAGSSVSWIEPAFDGAIASTLSEGSLTIYYFFSRLILYAVTSIISGYIQPATKYLAELAASDSRRELQRQTQKIVARAVLLGSGMFCLALVGLFLLRNSRIALLQPYLLMFRQNLLVLLLLSGYLFGLVAYAGYSNSLYVLGRERVYMIASFIVFPAGILAKFMGALTLGVKGLACGTSVYWMVYAAALFYCLSFTLKQRDARAKSASYSQVLQGKGFEL